MALTKREHVRPTITVRPDGPLAGHEFVMHRLGASEWIALRRGDLDDGMLVAAAVEAIQDTTLPEDVELDMFEGMAQRGEAFRQAVRALQGREETSA